MTLMWVRSHTLPCSVTVQAQQSFGLAAGRFFCQRMHYTTPRDKAQRNRREPKLREPSELP